MTEGLLVLFGAWWLLFKGDNESSGSGSSGGGSSGGGSSGGGSSGGAEDQGSGNTPSEESEDSWEQLVPANKCGWAVFKYCVKWKGHGWECAVCLVNQTTATMYVAEQPSPLPTYTLLNGTQFSAFKTKAEAEEVAMLLCNQDDSGGTLGDFVDDVADWWNSRRSSSAEEPAPAKQIIVRKELNSQPQFIVDPLDQNIGDIYSGRRY